MALPPQRNFLRPILEIAAQSGEAMAYKDILAGLIPFLLLSDTDLLERTRGGELRVEKHTRYSMHLLKRAGLLYAPSRGKGRGRYRITAKGSQYLQDYRDAINPAQLNMLAAEPGGQPGAPGAAVLIPDAGEISPEEQIEVTYEQLKTMLADDLLDALKAVSPERFEELVIDLLVKMGYGSGLRVGRSGDGGIDGIVTEDRLGFEKVYVQAKRWDIAQINAPEIRNFSGSLDPYGATKGVFITTSRFSGPARQVADDAARNNKTLRLIDGDELSYLMIEYGVGVVTKTTYEVQELDENYFADT